MPFSVGGADGGGLPGEVVAVVVVVVGVVVVGDGAWFPLFAHPATVVAIAMRTAPPATTIPRWPMRFELMIHVLSVRLCVDGWNSLAVPMASADW
jgi:hypothetical protein